VGEERLPDAPEPGVGPPPPVCATCGRSAPDLATAQVAWTRGSENGRDVWTCQECSRAHLRSIEGKLDSAWW
jgi:hypothetical protein